MTSGLEMEWDYSGRKGRDGQKKKIGKANERKGKVKRGKDEEVNGQGGKRGAPAPHGVNGSSIARSKSRYFKNKLHQRYTKPTTIAPTTQLYLSHSE